MLCLLYKFINDKQIICSSEFRDLKYLLNGNISDNSTVPYCGIADPHSQISRFIFDYLND